MEAALPRFCANISLLFTELPMLERPAAARAAGFPGIEIQFPYAEAPPDAWRRLLEGEGLGVGVVNFPVGDLMQGGFGLSTVRERQAAFRAGVAQAKYYAAAMRPYAMNVLAGPPPGEAVRDDCLKVLAENLAYAAAELAPLGVRVVTEPLNAQDRPGWLLNTSADAMAAIALAGHANLGIQYDLYHMHIMGDDLIPTMRRLLPCIHYIQFADAPGRHEPGSGVLDFPALFAAIDAMGYAGWVGAEYVPSGRTGDSLLWLPPSNP